MGSLVNLASASAKNFTEDVQSVVKQINHTICSGETVGIAIDHSVASTPETEHEALWLASLIAAYSFALTHHCGLQDTIDMVTSRLTKNLHHCEWVAKVFQNLAKIPICKDMS